MNTLAQDYNGNNIINYDPVPLIMPLLQKGYVVREDGKVVPGITSKAVDMPWIYVRHKEDINCGFSTDILFNSFNIFPKACLGCWKVVVRPRTVKELIQLLELEENLTNRPCKCGIERRPYVNALYGGYFYNSSEEEGLDCLADVKELVAKHISPDIKIILKRYCTEFEMKFGPSDQVEESIQRGYYTEPDGYKVPIMDAVNMEIWETIARKIFDVGDVKSYQPAWVKQHVIAEWFKWAWANGDMTVKEFFDGEPMFRPSVTYERKG